MVFVLSLAAMLCMGEQHKGLLAYLPPFRTRSTFDQKPMADMQPDTSRKP